MTTRLSYTLKSMSEQAEGHKALELRAAASIAHMFERNLYIRSWIESLLEQDV